MVRLAFGLLLAVACFFGGSVLAAPPPIEAYGKLPGIELVQISPSGTRYAFIATVGDQRRLIVATADGKPLQVAKIGRAHV